MIPSGETSVGGPLNQYGPPPPDPADDLTLNVQPTTLAKAVAPSLLSFDVFTIPSTVALKLVCAGIEALVCITRDVPPTLPSNGLQTPSRRSMQSGKENIVLSDSLTDLTKHQRQLQAFGFDTSYDEYDGINFKKTPIVNFKHSQNEHNIIGANVKPLYLQHNAIIRKFYSKKPPPISIEDYVLRIHKFCPMSTSVYLATSLYIHRLAVEERAIPVTRRNCHRLLLAGLRVAMKALEDLPYPHRRFSKVGGVSDNELARLEISFCFLTNFELRTTKEVLLDHALTLKQISSSQSPVGGHGFDMCLSLGIRNSGVITQEAAQAVTADA